MADNAPLNDFRALINSVPNGDDAAAENVRAILDGFPGPGPVLGTLADDLEWLAKWQRRKIPKIARPLVAVFAGTHKVAANFMNEDLLKIARQRVVGLSQQKAAVRGIAADMNAAFKVYEMGVEHPAPDILTGESLSEKDCAGAIAFGMEVVAEGADIIALGNAGTGTATAAAAIALALYGGSAEYWAGAHDHSAKDRIQAVEKAIAAKDLSGADPLNFLQYFGGRDIAGLVGAIVAARHQSIPIVLDGFVVCTAAAVVHAVNPEAIDHCIAGSITSEPAHQALLDRIGCSARHNFGISLGDGTGAALSMQTLKSAASALETLQ